MTEIKKVHLIAICGMGMGTLAGLLKSAGYAVSGSDENVYPPMSTQLSDLGIEIQSGFSADNLAHQPDLVIVGNTCKETNPEVQAAFAMGLNIMSFPQALKTIWDVRARLDAAGISHDVESYRLDAISIVARVPGEYWEIDFLDDGSIDFEVFQSQGVKTTDDLDARINQIHLTNELKGN